MTRRIAFLHNGPQRSAAALVGSWLTRDGLELDEYWAFAGEFPRSLDTHRGVFLSGSPHGAYEDLEFIHREHELIEDAASRELPMLGVCFGSQILASALCGADQVFRRASCEVGFKWLEGGAGCESDPLTRDAGARYRMFVWHNDEVRADHPDMRILASTEECPNQVWRYRDRPVWGIQGHPELTREAAADWLGARRERLERDGADVDALIEHAEEAGEAKTLIGNFADLCAA